MKHKTFFPTIKIYSFLKCLHKEQQGLSCSHFDLLKIEHLPNSLNCSLFISPLSLQKGISFSPNISIV